MASGTVARNLVLAKTVNGNFEKVLGANNFSPFKGKIFSGNAIETFALIKSLDRNYRYFPASHKEVRPAIHYAFPELPAEVNGALINPQGQTPADAVLTCTFVMAGIKPDKHMVVSLTHNGVQLKVQLPSKQLAEQIGDGLALATNFWNDNFMLFCDNLCSGTVIATSSAEFVSLKLVSADDWRNFNKSHNAAESSHYLPNMVKAGGQPGLSITVTDHISAPASRKEGLMGFVAAGRHEATCAPLDEKRPLLLVDSPDSSFKQAE